MWGRREGLFIEEPRRREGFGVFGERHPGREAIKERIGADIVEGAVEGAVAIGTAAVGGIAYLFQDHTSTEVPEWKKKKDGQIMSEKEMRDEANRIKEEVFSQWYKGHNEDHKIICTRVPVEGIEHNKVMNVLQTLKLHHFQEKTKEHQKKHINDHKKKHQLPFQYKHEEEHNYFHIPYQHQNGVRIKSVWEGDNFQSLSQYVKTPFLYVGRLSDQSRIDVQKKNQGCDEQKNENYVFIDADGKYFLNKNRLYGPLYCHPCHIEQGQASVTEGGKSVLKTHHIARFRSIDFTPGPAQAAQQAGKKIIKKPKTKKKDITIKKPTTKKPTTKKPTTKKPTTKKPTTKKPTTKKPTTKKTTTKKATTKKATTKKTTSKKPTSSKKPIKKTTTRKTVKKTTTKKK